MIEPGYKKILIRPRPIRALQTVSASYMSIYGKISVAYTYEGSKIRYNISIPANTGAVLDFSDQNKITVESGEYEFTFKDLQTIDDKEQSL